ncbi:prephenate dehydrogenase/arogenate dehydrogenase family protein [Rhodococcus sp. NPDC003318]|uniref:prephenate dehydrogenase/arogenate dehydrogenase family protein n=1 Tax=Rhodococcus sp. NPDC003318 TaxID=3364503 RepID=UPI0036A3D3FE
MTEQLATTVRSVVVAGGAGAVGSMFADLWSAAGATVTAADPATDPAGDIRDPGDALRTAIGHADVVMLAVPEDVALAAVDALLPLLRGDAVLVETLSVKSRFAAAVARAPAGGQVVGVNPMFAPALGLPGRSVLAVVHRGGPDADAVLDRMRAWGGHVEVTGADRHDRLCAAMQALTHAAVLAFGLALADLGIESDDLAHLAPPPHRTLSALLARITLGTPEVYRDVQTANPYAAQARSALSEALARLDAVCSGEPARFADLLAAARAPLGDRADDAAARCANLFEGLLR